MSLKFDIFGDDVGGSGSSEEPPTIKVNSNRHMSEMEIEVAIDKIRELCKRSVLCLRTAKNTLENNMEDLSWAIYLLEKAFLQAKEIAVDIGNEENGVKKTELVAQNIGIEISPDLITIDFPMLLPKRKANLKTDYYCKSLETILKGKVIPDQFCNSMTTIIFLHCYEKDHAHWAKKDHDNIELKWIIDALNNHFFIDDGPFRTSLYNHSTIDEKDHTLVFLVSTERLGEFLYKKIPEWEKQKVRYQK